jgi:hypothetical protein
MGCTPVASARALRIRVVPDGSGRGE